MNLTSDGTILIVDDESGIREILTLHVEALGYRCVEAHNGDEALRIVRQSKIDVIISDISMPSLNGVELLQILRDESFDLPFIFVTGQSTVESTVQALRLGAFDYIEKPFNLDEVERLLTEAIRVSFQKQELTRASGEKSSLDPEMEKAVQSQLSQIRALRQDASSSDQRMHSRSTSAAEEVGVFIAETIPQLQFCLASIDAMGDADKCAQEAGYLFRVSQSIRMAAEILALDTVVEVARDFEESFLAMRIYNRALPAEAIIVLRDATEALRRQLERMERGDFQLTEEDYEHRRKLGDLRLNLELAGVSGFSA